MATTKPRSKPFERFGTFVLFRKLDTHSLGEVWRAAKIENGSLGSLVALHRLAGDKSALNKAVDAARNVVPQISGGAVVRGQAVDIIDGVPAIVHEYSGGRTLRHIVDRARGGTAAAPQPVPTDQAIAITEKIATSVEAIGEMKVDGKRLIHGALLPQFVWITEDGDVRTLGHQIASGVIATAATAAGRDLLPYIAPEIRESREATKASDVYSLGAILYLLVTGEEPPDGVTGNIPNALASAMMMNGEESVPPEIKTVIQRSLNPSVAERYSSAAEFRQALTQLMGGGAYAPTTFNLAFYLHTLLRKEMEGEAFEREKESKINLAPYIEELTAPAEVAEAPATRAAAKPVAVTAPSFGGIQGADEEKKSKAPLIAIAAGVLIAVLAGGYFMMNRHTAPVAAKPVQAAAAPLKPAPQPVAPVVAAAPTATSTAATAATSADEAARKKAIEDEVNRRLQEELQKLQGDYEKQLQKQNAQKTSAPSVASAATAPVRQDPVRSAASDDSRPTVPVRSEPVQQDPTQTSAPAPAPAVVQPQVQAAAPAVPDVREGDLVASAELDQQPSIVRKIAPTYPPMALRQRAQASVLVTVLISETGQVLDVKVLRGAPQRLGFDEAAVRAARSFVFRPGTKSGKRVKTWFPIPFNFAL